MCLNKKLYILQAISFIKKICYLLYFTIFGVYYHNSKIIIYILSSSIKSFKIFFNSDYSITCLS